MEETDQMLFWLQTRTAYDNWTRGQIGDEEARRERLEILGAGNQLPPDSDRAAAMEILQRWGECL